ncbi:MAG: tetratricopeptide repeat protein [Leptolyngbyaceae cyanobacterium RM1_406_9]|nr:tetratricopeptide repeat protein [Leptolyngbyaceae cyanobacterium RM1_406_9]
MKPLAALTALAALLLTHQTAAVSQEREGCFAIFSSGQVVDLNRICQSDRPNRQNSSSSQAYQQGYGLSREERHEEAIASFTQAIQLDPNNAEAYRGRAHAQVLTGNRSAAVRDYEQAAQLYRRRGDTAQQICFKTWQKNLEL